MEQPKDGLRNGWIIDVRSHEEYLQKLTPKRLEMLRKHFSYQSWKVDALKAIAKISDEPANRTERAIVFAAHEIIESIKEHKYDVLLAGIGISHLAAWMATYTLRSNNFEIQLIVELGLYGYVPPPTQPFLISTRGLESCLMLTDALNILGFIANKTQVLACLSAGQIDKHGNINSTKIGDFFLFGSGGANDISTTAKEVIVTLLHDRRRLVEEVPYITCPGKNIKKVITDRAVLEKQGKELILKKIYVGKAENKDDAVSFIKQNMGWDLKISDNLILLEEPSKEEILMLRCFDPQRYFLGKLKS